MGDGKRIPGHFFTGTNRKGVWCFCHRIDLREYSQKFRKKSSSARKVNVTKSQNFFGKEV